MSEAEHESGIDVKLLELARLSADQGPLAWDAERGELVSRWRGLPIRCATASR